MTTRRAPGRRGHGRPSAGHQRGSAQRYGTSGVVNHALHDYAKHAIPWLAWALTLVVGVTLNAFASTSWSLVGVVTLLLVSTIGVTWAVWETCASKSALALWHGVATSVTGGLWLVMCTITGFVTVTTGPDGAWVFDAQGPTIGIWAIGGLMHLVLWHMRINARDRAAELAEYMASINPEPTKMELAGLPGASWSLRKVNEFRREGTLFLAPGQTYDDVTKHLEDIASAHDLPPGSIRAYQPKGTLNARKVRVDVMLGNPIADPIPWPGLLVGAK